MIAILSASILESTVKNFKDSTKNTSVTSQPRIKLSMPVNGCFFPKTSVSIFLLMK
jgi:hypothetical protein